MNKVRMMEEVRELGRGGFAVVAEVEDESGDRFAKKTFSPMDNVIAAVGEEHLKRRFIREVKYQSMLDHQNIVPIEESFLDDSPPYFIMPLAECTLQYELTQDLSLGGRFKEMLFDVLAGLECMHENGYVHRDLKPANILKFLNGREYYAISDFGLIAATDSDSSTLTGSNAGGGTANYAAPESMRNFKAATFRADIYSFGAILHDLFGNGARRVPYTELSLPGQIGEVVAKCTKTNSARRYQSISALRDDLYQVLDETEVVFSSSDEEELVDAIKANSDLSDDQWDGVFFFLEELDERMSGAGNIFAAISEDHIVNLAETSPELLSALGHYFSDYIRHNSFNFDYCDILASRAERYYEEGDMGLQASLVLSLLELGVSHNRWYVERKFLHLTGHDISDQLANRIVGEIEAMDLDFPRLVQRLESSISASRSELHPILQNYLSED